MKWFDNIKLRSKYFFVFGILLVAMITFVVFSILQITGIGSDLNDLVNTYQAQQIDIADAILDAYSMRLVNLVKGNLLEDEGVRELAYGYQEDYRASVDSFRVHLENYRYNMLSDPRHTELEKQNCLDALEEITETFLDYMKITGGLDVAVENGDRNEVLRIYSEAFPVGTALGLQLQVMRDLVFSTTKEKAFQATDHMAVVLRVFYGISILIIPVFVLALLFTIRSINQPISTLEMAVVEIANGNLGFPIRNERKDELGVLANSIGNMVDKISEHNKMIAIMDHLDSMICVSDLEYNFLYLNKRLADKFGIDREKCIGQKCYKATRNLDEPCNFCQLTKLISQKDEYPTYDFDYVWDDVSNVWIGGTDSIIPWVDGTTVHFQAIRDVTQRKHQEELLEEALTEAKAASVAKSSFLANMSHEIRTPMNAILGITEIQLQDETTPQKIREALDKIHHSGNLLLGIINDILDLSKIEAGKLELTPTKYETASLINDTVTLNMMRIGSKPIEFVLSVADDIPTTLYGDELRIKQILNNLISNSIKYTKEGVVKLLASVEAADAAGTDESVVMLVFRVTDTGQGMTEEQVSKLFDEYSRFNMEANRTTEGTGLGMSITRNLMRMMNGEISVESKVNTGSVFTIRIPQTGTGSGVLGRELADSLEKFKTNSDKQMRRAQVVFEPMPYGKILVTDDVESNLYVATGLMAPYGLSVETVMSGYEAIEKIKKGNVYDIVFMDHMMPGMDGIETTRNIRDLGYKHPIIALTANAVVGQSDIFLANGFDAFISKPIDVRQLNAMLKQFVRDKQPPEVIEAAQRQAQGKQAADTAAAQPPVSPSLNPRLAEIFISDARKAIAVLESVQAKQGAYGDDDIRLYIINVHGMKSGLANIGETELSAAAAKLEQAGKEKNTAVMTAETPVFLSGLQTIIEKLSPKKEKDETGTTADNAVYLREKLLAVKEACGIFDKKAAKDAINELRQKTWTKAADDLLAAMAEHLLNGDFEEAARTADMIIAESGK